MKNTTLFAFAFVLLFTSVTSAQTIDIKSLPSVSKTDISVKTFNKDSVSIAKEAVQSVGSIKKGGSRSITSLVKESVDKNTSSSSSSDSSGPTQNSTCAIDSFEVTTQTGYATYSFQHNVYWATTGCASVTINGAAQELSGSLIRINGEIVGIGGQRRFTIVATDAVGIAITQSKDMYFPQVISVYSTSVPSVDTLAVGSTNVRIGTIDTTELTPNVGTHALGNFMISGLCPTDGGESPFRNIRVMDGDTVLGTFTGTPTCYGVGMSNLIAATIPWEVTPYTLAPGQTRTFTVYGDVLPSGKVGQEFPFALTVGGTYAGSSAGGSAAHTIVLTGPTASACEIVSFTAKLPEAYGKYANFHDLNWETVGCQSLTINDISFDLTGSVVTKIGQSPAVWGKRLAGNYGSTTYILVATAKDGSTISRDVTMYFPVLGAAHSTTEPLVTSVAAGSMQARLATVLVTEKTLEVMKEKLGSIYLYGACPTNGTPSPLSNVRYMIEGQEIGVFATVTCPGLSAHQYLDYNGFRPEFAPGETKVMTIYADVAANATDGSTLSLSYGALLGTAYSEGGSTPKHTVMITGPKPVDECVITSLTATPMSIKSFIGSPTLAWTTTGCVSATMTAPAILKSIPSTVSVPVNGTRTDTIFRTTTFTLTAKGANGESVSKNVTVTLTPPPIIVTPIQTCKITSFVATPAKIALGGTSILSWTTENCKTVTIGKLSYLANGSTEVQPGRTTEYTLIASAGKRGSDTAKTTVEVICVSAKSPLPKGMTLLTTTAPECR